MEENEKVLEIGNSKVGDGYPTYFVADIAANHDGDIERAKELIYLCAEAGTDAAKFQHFSANTIVSDYGFKHLGGQQSHQGKWKKSVYEVYQEASINQDWTPILKETCEKAGISFFTSPYSFELIDHVDPFVPAYKIGSGDITWIEIIEYIAKKGKPYILATGASTLQDVKRAVDAAVKINPALCLMQCNTNYTANLENFKYIQLNVLNKYRDIFPDLVLGLSDHTPGHTTVLGAVALGAKVIEKHFTDDTNREGPDHAFSMDPVTWKEMVDRTRELENALGTDSKKIEDNEKETVVLQRRSIRSAQDISKGTVLSKEDVTMLRPCPHGAIQPHELNEVLGKKINQDIKAGAHITWSHLE